MKIKNYNEAAFEELKKSLFKHIDGGNSVHVLLKMINEVNEQFPGIKNIFIHDMGSFLTHWFSLVQDSRRCSLPLRAKILTVDMVMKYSDFNNFSIFCYDKIDQTVNKHTNRLLANDILSYLTCVIKAVIQSTRRSIGLDLNSKKYGVKTNTGTAAVSAE